MNTAIRLSILRRILKERLQIDRDAKRIIYTVLDAQGRRYQQILEDDKQIFTLLNELGDECLVERQEPVTLAPDAKPALEISYRIDTRTKQGKTYMCEDSFDRYHIPERLGRFCCAFKKYFEKQLRLGELFDETYYNREVTPNDYCFVIVQFSDYGRDYAHAEARGELVVQHGHGASAISPVGNAPARVDNIASRN